jgi:hypothetical protein
LLEYVSIPVLAKLRLRILPLETYFLAGPRVDFLVSRNAGVTSFYDKFRKFDIGGTFGVGLELHQLLPIDLTTEFRYSPNFNDSFNGNFFGRPLKVKNKSFELLLGVRL